MVFYGERRCNRLLAPASDGFRDILPARINRLSQVQPEDVPGETIYSREESTNLAIEHTKASNLDSLPAHSLSNRAHDSGLQSRQGPAIYEGQICRFGFPVARAGRYKAEAGPVPALKKDSRFSAV